MKDKIKFDFKDEERSLIIKALNMFGNYLSAQDKSTDSVDEILLKLEDTSKVELDKYEMGTTINALNSYRYKLKSMNMPRTEVNDILLKMIDETDKKKVFSKTLTRDNARRY